MTDRCRRDRFCKQRVKADGVYLGIDLDRNGLCRLCELAAFDDLSNLDADYKALRNAIPATALARNGLEPTHGGRPGDGCVFPVAYDAVMTSIVIETVRWARVLTGEAELPRDDGECVAWCVSVIRSRTGTLVDLPPRQITTFATGPDGDDRFTVVTADGVDAVLALARLHRSALALLGSDGRIWRHDPCPCCHMAALSQSPDHSLITCHACGSHWASAVFPDLGRMLALS
jgi:hypothetical protein